MSAKQYARLVPKKHRAQRTPVIDRPMRPQMIAWAGPSAFYPNRFYEIDKWYKGRIDKPEEIPKFYTIDPTNHLHSLADLLEREKPKHPDINIGFVPRSTPSVAVKSDEDRAVLERKSRKMDTNVVRHYGVFEHLFGKGVFFENVQNLDVSFGDNGVFFGNTLSASLTSSKPQVRIESVKAGEYNTLIMLNLDGNPYEKEGEIVHWMVANISDGESIENGDEVLSLSHKYWFSVIPSYHGQSDQWSGLLCCCSDSLDGRVFVMSHFYKENEDTITPSFISFFQTSYDISVKNQLHGMGLKSPLYEYKYNEPLKPEQKEFPKKPQPFDLYLDMYRDPKEIEQELLEERLRRAQLDDYQVRTTPYERDIDDVEYI
ncbi:unnamed protein product [Angiostrongylus costaricensis]|uniref:Uncharacterized protein n=1 Tax=Angiostrongylus costaricensis TaxID=334426 RepID=A0A0R3PJK4_ANGCS|nr:unnamed protein product [Angiostrongylus costaricensis]